MALLPTSLEGQMSSMSLYTGLSANYASSSSGIEASVASVYEEHKPSSPLSPFSYPKPYTWVALKEWHKNLLIFLKTGQSIQPPRRYSGFPSRHTPNPALEFAELFAWNEILKVEALTFVKQSPFSHEYSKSEVGVIKNIFKENIEERKNSLVRRIENRLFSLAQTSDGRHVIFHPELDAACAAMLIMDQGKNTGFQRELSKIEEPQELEEYIKNYGLVPVCTVIPANDKMQRIIYLQKLLDKDGPGILFIQGNYFSFIIDKIVTSEAGGGSVEIRDPHHGWAITITLKALLKTFRSNNSLTFLQTENPEFGFVTKKARPSYGVEQQ